MEQEIHLLITRIKNGILFTSVHFYNGSGKENFKLYYNIDGFYKSNYFNIVISKKETEFNEILTPTKEPEVLKQKLEQLSKIKFTIQK